MSKPTLNQTQSIYYKNKLVLFVNWENSVSFGNYVKVPIQVKKDGRFFKVNIQDLNN